MSALLAFALATAAAAPMIRTIPEAETACDALSTGELVHHEALRIDRDFGKPEFDLVVDAWTSTANPTALVDVRLWWVKTTAADRRSPLSTRAQKYVDIETVENGPGHWSLELRGDKKEFRFDVEIGDDGKTRAYTDIVDDAGKRVRHCMVADGELKARRVLGIPVGIEALVVDCTDSAGRVHHGRAVVRSLRR